jgi:hypothetical protein
MPEVHGVSLCLDHAFGTCRYARIDGVRPAAEWLAYSLVVTGEVSSSIEQQAFIPECAVLCERVSGESALLLQHCWGKACLCWRMQSW